MPAKPLILALCSTLLLPAALAARQSDQLTVVAPPQQELTYQRWSDRTATRLSNSIKRSARLDNDKSSTGYTRIQFRLNGEGRPEAIDFAQPSPSRTINRLSMRAVRTMGSLYPLPQSIPAHSRFEAWIIVANDAVDHELMLETLRADHRARTMAMAGSERPVLIAMR